MMAFHVQESLPKALDDASSCLIVYKMGNVASLHFSLLIYGSIPYLLLRQSYFFPIKLVRKEAFVDDNHSGNLFPARLIVPSHHKLSCCLVLVHARVLL